jgi:hypothetical protein
MGKMTVKFGIRRLKQAGSDYILGQHGHQSWQLAEKTKFAAVSMQFAVKTKNVADGNDSIRLLPTANYLLAAN